MRVILFTGKGGVGKTSLSTATALACARRGKKTIVLSTDAAHSLGDVLQTTVGNEAVQVEKNLWAQEVSVHAELRRNWGRVQKYLTQFLASQGYQEAVAEELAVVPGMEDLFALIKLLEIRDGGEFDVAIIDCAPTGSTLQLLGLADVLQWYMEKFYDIEKKIALAIKPIVERVIKAPMPDKDVYANIEKIYDRVIAVRDLLTDPAHSSIRLVTNPEKIVLQETQRAHTYLSLFGYPIDAVMANRVLPAAAGDGYFKGWVERQQEYIDQIERSFAPLPILQTPMFAEEMLGLDMLAEMANVAYGDRDPSDVLWTGRPFKLDGSPGNYDMVLALPGVEKDEVDLWAKDEELIISIGNYQRHLILPRALDEHFVTRARLTDGYFHIHFAKEA
ncbi:MAG: ArsA family ATPase [Deltaproteobacteria bacterium]|nr:ArsA family ATPase [Deltaproteobacteria bacterium]MCB9488709.1 ArsA family ATPase [Deltaproteobacteria bacterium]